MFLYLSFKKNNIYSCDICETNYDNPNDIVDHNTDIHPNNEYYLCDQCEYEAISQSLLQEHITATHVHLSCDYCGFVAKNRGGLTRHINAKHVNANESEKHPDENSLNNLEESNTIFACDICDTNCQDGLIEHNNNMHQYYTCDQCDFDGYGQMIMECHTSTSHPHFSCEECDFIGKNKGGLTRHRKAKHENTKDQNHINPTAGDDRVEPSILTINFPGHSYSISSGNT